MNMEMYQKFQEIDSLTMENEITNAQKMKISDLLNLQKWNFDAKDEAGKKKVLHKQISVLIKYFYLEKSYVNFNNFFMQNVRNIFTIVDIMEGRQIQLLILRVDSFQKKAMVASNIDCQRQLASFHAKMKEYYQTTKLRNKKIQNLQRQVKQQAKQQVKELKKGQIHLKKNSIVQTLKNSLWLLFTGSGQQLPLQSSAQFCQSHQPVTKLTNTDPLKLINQQNVQNVLAPDSLHQFFSKNNLQNHNQIQLRHTEDQKIKIKLIDKKMIDLLVNNRNGYAQINHIFIQFLS